jgi:hypothetical protein
MRELYAAFSGANKVRLNDRRMALSLAWQTANLTNAAKLPPLDQLLKRLSPGDSSVMSPRDQRATILGMAEAMGAKVVRRKKGEAIQ